MTDNAMLPQFDADEVLRLARERFALEGNIRALDGERDLNFLIDAAQGKFVFKIANADESPGMLECQHLALQRIAAAGVFEQAVTAQPSVAGNLIETVTSAGGQEHVCRVLPFVEGRLWGEIETPDPALLRDLGQRLARFDLALQDFAHPALERPLLWKMDDAFATLARCRPKLVDTWQTDLVDHFTAEFSAAILPRLGDMRRGVIHNDANRGNVLVSDDGLRVSCLIDYGDMVNSWLAAEVAIAAAYAMLDSEQPLAVAQQVLAGYHATLPLEDVEIGALFGFICMRLCLSVCVCAYQREQEPDNEYLSVDEAATWKLLRELRQLDYAAVREILFAACERA